MNDRHPGWFARLACSTAASPIAIADARSPCITPATPMLRPSIPGESGSASVPADTTCWVRSQSPTYHARLPTSNDSVDITTLVAEIVEAERLDRRHGRARRARRTA